MKQQQQKFFRLLGFLEIENFQLSQTIFLTGRELYYIVGSIRKAENDF